MSLSEEELEKQCIVSPIIETITDNEQDEEVLLVNELWLTLTKTAAHKKTISYMDLAKSLSSSTNYKIHYNKVIGLLKPIAQFCTEGECPPLTHLAIIAKLKLPQELKKEHNAENDFEAIKTQIYNFEWSGLKQKFDSFLNKNKEI